MEIGNGGAYLRDFKYGGEGEAIRPDHTIAFRTPSRYSPTLVLNNWLPRPAWCRRWNAIATFIVYRGVPLGEYTRLLDRGVIGNGYRREVVKDGMKKGRCHEALICAEASHEDYLNLPGPLKRDPNSQPLLRNAFNVRETRMITKATIPKVRVLSFRMDSGLQCSP